MKTLKFGLGLALAVGISCGPGTREAFGSPTPAPSSDPNALHFEWGPVNATPLPLPVYTIGRPPAPVEPTTPVDPYMAAALSGGALGVFAATMLADGLLQPTTLGYYQAFGAYGLGLALGSCGVGHFVAHDPLRGFLWIAGAPAVVATANLAGAQIGAGPLDPGGSRTANLAMVTIGLAYAGLAAYDAFETAKRFNASIPVKVPTPPGSIQK